MLSRNNQPIAKPPNLFPLDQRFWMFEDAVSVAFHSNMKRYFQDRS